MNKSTFDALIATMRPYLNPPHPGRGRNNIVGMLVGFLLGPLGVGLYFKSLFDFAACLALVILTVACVDVDPAFVSGLIGLIWAAARIAHDTPKPPGGDAPRAPGQPEPEPLFEGAPA